MTRLLLFALALLAAAAGAASFPEPFNTEKPDRAPRSPAEALAAIKLPPGFQATLFAAEPDVRQPIAMAFDPRGRLWVAENYTYADAKTVFDTNLLDRVVIFADADHDGRFDSRKVFWDRAKILTSVEVGRGGVFVVCPPQLLFLADRDGDDVPDGEPEVLLDGFTTTGGNRHTFANGLRWGPDGWLWGRVGISSQARIGRPGAPEAERVAMNGGVWRYHPEHRVVEAVSHGTTNPWGLDWNAEGEPFFINTVIGHLWHAIPGAHFQRMHGQDVHPHSYALIPQHADHYHFDTGKSWQDSTAGQEDAAVAPTSDALGGGHAHTGLMIYQGENWPEALHGRLFTINFHGRRFNVERLERNGSGYVGRHEPDMVFFGDPWFRGIDLIQGPDGGVFVADWSDTGECHDHDGIHRSSGRIYKITHGTPKERQQADLATLPDEKLVALLFERNEWLARMARRVLADRAAAGRDLSAARRTLETVHPRQPDTRTKLRALWGLNALGAAPPAWLLEQTRDADEHVRSWAVRLLAEPWPVLGYSTGRPVGYPATASGRPAPEVLARFVELARTDHSALVRLYLASNLRRLPWEPRRELASALLGRNEDLGDHNLPLLLWYGVSPLITAQPGAGAELALNTHHRLIRQFTARRLAEMRDDAPAALAALLRGSGRESARGPDLALDLLRGLADAYRGLRKAAPPEGWAEFSAAVGRGADGETRERLRDLNLLFGDGHALDELRRLVGDKNADGAARRAAVKSLLDAGAPDLAPLLRAHADDYAIRGVALAGLLRLDAPDAAGLALSKYRWIDPPERAQVLAEMASRPAAAGALLRAVADGQVPRTEVTPFLARQIAGLGDAALTQRLTEVWGAVQATDAAQHAALERWRARLTPERLAKADLAHGRVVFAQACVSCHVLYGTGGNVGPDLTGSGRANLDYLLENLVTPSAVVAAEYRMVVANLKDGRSLNGFIRAQDDHTLTLQTPTEAAVIARADLESLETSALSLMPEGLLEALEEPAARDLVAYLMHPAQVPLPAGGAK
ncbi:MAG: PVC-type heme-binding CxxCH protein [Limisphaerales bacterium]